MLSKVICKWEWIHMDSVLAEPLRRAPPTIHSLMLCCCDVNEISYWNATIARNHLYSSLHLILHSSNYIIGNGTNAAVT